MKASVRRASDVLCMTIGPTASGKLNLALELAYVLPGVLGASDTGEIVSVDALQLYRDIGVGTTKTPVEERRGITHHQTDVLEVRDETLVAAYQKHARADMVGIRECESVTVVTGDSGLYQRTLPDVIEFPGADPAVCTRLEEEVEGPMGSRGLHDRLTQLDLILAEHIDPHSARRIIRALEVIELTGRPYSASIPYHEFVVPSLMMALRRLTEELDSRITMRAHAMMDGGLIEEVCALIDVGLRRAKIASRAMGYARALAVIDGQMSKDEAVESIVLATRQLACRQVKWLRPGPRVYWLDVENFDSNEAVARHVVGLTQRETESPLGRS